MYSEEYKHRVNLRVSTETHERIMTLAKKHNRNINAQIVHILKVEIDEIDYQKNEIEYEKAGYEAFLEEFGPGINLQETTLPKLPEGLKKKQQDDKKMQLSNQTISDLFDRIANEIPEKVIEKMLNKYHSHLLQIFTGFILSEEEDERKQAS